MTKVLYLFLIQLSSLQTAISATIPATCKTIQHPFPSGCGGDTVKADAIRNEYCAVWNAYEKFAFGNDTLLPVSHQAKNDFYGWGLTIVDGLDTAIVMGLTDIAAKQLEWIYHIDFMTSSVNNGYVQGFDSIIRYVGGLISAYDLINSNIVPEGTYNETHVNALVKQATILSDKLKPLFDSPTGLPYANISFITNEAVRTDVANTAQAGTVIHEWHRLSDLTGDDSYRLLADKAESVLLNPQPTPLFPGLVGSSVNTNTGQFDGFDVGWQSGIDSFYEYLIKVAIYEPTAPTSATYRAFWETAAQSTLEHLVSHPFKFPQLTFITEYDRQGLPKWSMDDYACFAGGNFLLGGTYLNLPEISALGLAITDSCHQLYNTTASGLNPTNFYWFNETNHTYDPKHEADPAAVAYFQRAGYVVDTVAWWTGFPEPIESLFYAYRITSDSIWQEYAWEIFESILSNTNRSTEVPYVDLWDINQKPPGDAQDYLPSYYFAETLKYLYLIFAPPDHVSLDEWSFNTEAHPVKIQGGTCAVERKRFGKDV